VDERDKRASWYVGRPVKNAGEDGRGRRGRARVSVDWEGVYVDAALRVDGAGRRCCRPLRDVEEQANAMVIGE
jgi:hypothetical protein